jgi:DNA-binding response OmpR family regulator
MRENIKILLLEDDLLFAQTLEDFLDSEGYSVDLCHDGEKALTKCYENSYHLLLLDVNVPSLNGFSLLNEIRKQNDNTPTIYITSFKDKESIQKGFQVGADDYLKKPIDLDELSLRIKAILKRTNLYFNTFKIGSFTYNFDSKTLYSQTNETITLSKKVALLLELFIQTQNKIVTKEKIFQTLWSWDESPSDASLRVYINDLKKVLGKESITNLKGVGYQLRV